VQVSKCYLNIHVRIFLKIYSINPKIALKNSYEVLEIRKTTNVDEPKLVEKK